MHARPRRFSVGPLAALAPWASLPARAGQPPRPPVAAMTESRPRPRIRAPRAAALVLCLLVPAAAHALPVQIPFRLVSERFMVVRVQVGPHGAAPFVVDTASSVTVVSPELARRIGLVPIASREVLTHVDAGCLPVARLEGLQLGRRVVPPLDVLIADLGALWRHDRSVEGVLGQDAFVGTNLLIDYRKRRLTIDPAGLLAPFLDGHAVDMRHQGRRVLVDVAVTLTRPWPAVPVRLVLDSAAMSVTLFERDDLKPAHFALSRLLGHVQIESLHGRRTAIKGHVDELAVGSNLLSRVPATLTDRPDWWGASEQDGLLPTTLFESLYFDYRAGTVIFNPRWTGYTPQTVDALTP